MKITPLSDRIVVEAESTEEATASGFIVKTEQKERPQRGKVIAVGLGKLLKDGTRVPMEVKIGDTVVFKKYSPTDIEIDGKEYLILESEDVLGVIA